MDKKPIKRKKSYEEDELSNEEKKIDIIKKKKNPNKKKFVKGKLIEEDKIHIINDIYIFI